MKEISGENGAQPWCTARKKRGIKISTSQPGVKREELFKLELVTWAFGSTSFKKDDASKNHWSCCRVVPELYIAFGFASIVSFSATSPFLFGRSMVIQ